MEPPLCIEFKQNNLIQFLNRNKHAYCYILKNTPTSKLTKKKRYMEEEHMWSQTKSIFIFTAIMAKHSLYTRK